MKTLQTLSLLSALVILPMAPTAAMPFNPVIDEFWVVKNGVENFRDSFNDGAVPASGPEDGITTSGNTYSVAGGGGFTGEAGGKLTMTPALGTPTLITGSTADTFTGARRLRSTNPASSAHLGFGDSFEIRGLFDLTSLPSVTGQSFGIRASDRSATNTGNDVMQVHVVKSSISGNTGVRYAEVDFIADTSTTEGFFDIEAFLPSASQIELVISKEANTDEVMASFLLYDLSSTVLLGVTLGTIGQPLSIYDGEDYTRPQFFATDTGIPVPEPANILIFAVGLAGLGFARRRRAAAAVMCFYRKNCRGTDFACSNS